MNPRRLYRSRDRMLAGVAGGMAEYLEIDPTVSRILWIIVGIATGGFALLVYIVLALVIPPTPYLAPAGTGGWAPAPGTGTWPPAPAGAPGGASAGWAAPGAPPAWAPPAWAPPVAPAPEPRAESRGFGAAAIVGVVLIVFGAIALADVALPGWVAGALLGPAVILALGAALLVSSLRRGEPAAAAAPVSGPAPTVEANRGDPAASAAPAPWDVTDTQAVEPVADPAGTGAQPA